MEKSSPPTKSEGSTAEFDTLNFISASPLFARCRNMMAAGNGGLQRTHHDRGRLAQMSSGPLTRCRGCRRHEGPFLPTPSWQTRSLLLVPPAGRAGQLLEWLTQAQLHRVGGIRETGLVPGEPGFGAHSSPQPHLGVAHQPWPRSPMEQEAPDQPLLGGGAGSHVHPCGGETFSRDPPPTQRCSVKAPTSPVSTPVRCLPARRCLARVWPTRQFGAGTS